MSHMYSLWGRIVKQIEKVGIPAVDICTVTPISQTVGAARISAAQATPYPTGNPHMTEKKEYLRRQEVVMKALNLAIK